MGGRAAREHEDYAGCRDPTAKRIDHVRTVRETAVMRQRWST